MRGRRKIGAMLGLVLLCSLVFTGCGKAKVPETVTVPTISVSDKGIITSYMVEDFDKNYYNISELSKMVMDEAAEFNGTRQQEGDTAPVTVEKVEMAGDGSPRAVVAYQFISQETYKEFTEADFFYGTVEQALEAGYEIGGELVSVKNPEESFHKDEIDKIGSRHILILEEKTVVVCPKKVLYISSNGAVNQDGTIDASQGEGLTYIIMK